MSYKGYILSANQSHWGGNFAI